MPASFPSSVKSWTDKQDLIDDVFAGDINGAYHEIIAIENELMQIGYKRSVRVATTQNGDLATAFANGQTVDGVVLATGDRILIKDQTNGAENGIYIVNASGAPTRATDANSSAHMVPGLMVYVREGTINGKGTWKLTTTGTITLGTTPLTFENELRSHLAEDATTSQKGHVQLSTSTSSTSTTLAATPSAVKQAYDLANAAIPKSGGTMSGELNLADNLLTQPYMKDYAEVIGTTPATTGTCTFNLETGNVFTLTPTGNVTIGFTNPPASGRAGSVTVILTNSSTVYAKTFGSAIKWPNDEVPDLSEANKTYILVFSTTNGGATWRGACVGTYSA